MRADVLFYVFVTIFILTAILTLLGVANLVKIRKGYLNALFTSLILEVVGGVVALYKMEVFTVTPPPSQSVVMDFYCSVARHEYERAYNLIDSNCNFRKSYSLDIFKRGYADTISINLITVVPIVNSPNDKNHEYAVYYCNELNMPTRPAPGDLRTVRFKDIQRLVDNVNSLRQDAVSKGLNGKTIDDLTIQEMTVVNNQSRIANLLVRDLGISNAEELVAELVFENRIVRAVRFYKVSLSEIHGKWYIERFKEEQ